MRRHRISPDPDPDQWQRGAKACNDRFLTDNADVDVWADGIHLKVGLTQDNVCLLVMIGVRPDGGKELIALADGRRESTESWAGLREVFHDTKEQRCWSHRIANVLNCLPKSTQPSAKAALAEIWQAKGQDHALKAVSAFEAPYGAKWHTATAKITDVVNVLLAFFDYPRGTGSKAAGIAMAFTLIQSAQSCWRAVNAHHFVPFGQRDTACQNLAACQGEDTTPFARLPLNTHRVHINGQDRSGEQAIPVPPSSQSAAP